MTKYSVAVIAGRHDRLAPDADDAIELADDDGVEAHDVGARERRLVCARRAVCSSVCWGVVMMLPLFAGCCSTSRMNSSSSRLVLVRIDSTSIPAAVRREKMSFRFCSFDTSISSV